MRQYESYKDSGTEWIGEIPSYWESKRFKYLFDLISTKTNNNLLKVGLENVESWTGKFTETDSEFEGEGIHFIKNDILFGKLRPYLAKALLCDFEGQAVGDFFVFRCKNEIMSHFAINLILSARFIDYVNGSTFGSKMPRASWDFISNLIVPIPPIAEQYNISTYLDKKTSEIDVLIGNKKKLLELYEEEKRAIINQAATKGITPGVKMKDSGIQWFGGIPENWEIKQIKHLVSKVGSGVTPSGGASVYQTIGIPLLRSQNIHFDGLKLDDVAFITEEMHKKMDNSKVLPGDVLLNITGASIGRTFYADRSLGQANVNQHVCILRPTKDIETKYLYYILRSDIGQRQIESEQTGSGREGLNFAALKDFSIPIAPKKEQLAVVHYLEQECSRLDAKISKATKEVDLLTEYRTTLISEVVMGKIKVTD
jgi:type I restriction enzyme S subunit